VRRQTEAAFTEYLGAVEAAYIETDRGLELPGDGLDPVRSEVLLASSASLGEAIASEAPVLADSELVTASLASIALDFTIAADLLHLEAQSEIFAPLGLDAAEIAPRPQGLEPFAEVVADARRAFPQQQPDGLAGSAPGPRDPVDLAQAAIAELLEKTVEPASHFAVGLAAAGVSQITTPLMHLVELPNPFKLPGVGHGLFQRGTRRLLSLVDPEALLDSLRHLSLDVIADELASEHKSVAERALDWIADAGACELGVTTLLSTRAVDRDELERRLEKLRGQHETNMRWSERAAWAMKWGGPLVIVASGGVPGVIGLSCAQALGLAVTVYLLADRLDTLPPRIDLIAGVQRISSECLLP
jgi:hypothetical protein